jgi:hypothetical protein
MGSKRTKEGYAWLYWDCRRQSRDGYWFTILGNHEIDRAIQSLSSAAALKMYLYICKVSNGRTAFTCPDGIAIGEAMIAEACGISRASMYRATQELRKAGLLQVSKMGGETRALLVSPQEAQENDLRENLTSEKKAEKDQKIQSRIQDCNGSQNLDAVVQLCQKVQSQICDNDQKQQDLINYPHKPPIDQIESEAINLNYQARSNERVNTSRSGAHEEVELSVSSAEALKGVSDFLKEPNQQELALCSILIKADVIEEARNNGHAFVERVTRKTLKNGYCVLQEHGWSGSLRKRSVSRVLDTVLTTYFSEEMNREKIKQLIENRENGWLSVPIAANGPKTENAAEVHARTKKPLPEEFIKQYEDDLNFYLSDPDVARLDTGSLFGDQVRGGGNPQPHAYQQYMRLIGELDDLCSEKTDYQPTPDQIARMRKIMIDCGNVFMKLMGV